MTGSKLSQTTEHPQILQSRYQSTQLVSQDYIDFMRFFFLKVLNDRTTTKAEMQVMGYLIRKYLRLEGGVEKRITLSPTDWTQEAGIPKKEIEKTLKKCEEKGWIQIRNEKKQQQQVQFITLNREAIKHTQPYKT